MSKIEWTESTWNPVTGCTKVSPGCKNCYAETMSHRLQAMGVEGYKEGFNVVTCHPTRLGMPKKRKKPTMYFVNSMSDIFHKSVPYTFIDQILTTIRDTPHHTYQILTKRPQEMVSYFTNQHPCNPQIPDNVWLGVSVEDRRYGVPRMKELQKIEAKTRFLSIEPLLGPLGSLNLKGIHWVIVGGESGSKARPMQPEWITDIHQQCIEQKVPFFFKQWGSYGSDGVKRSKKHNGRLYQGRLWNEMPTVDLTNNHTAYNMLANLTHVTMYPLSLHITSKLFKKRHF